MEVLHLKNIANKFRLFQTGQTEFSNVVVNACYPGTDEYFKYLEQKYPELSESLSSIFLSTNPINKGQYRFFEGTIIIDDKEIPFVNYISPWYSPLNRISPWYSPLTYSENIRNAKNYVILPGRGIEHFNLGNYNSQKTDGYMTYKQEFVSDNQEILYEKDNEMMKNRFLVYYSLNPDENFSYHKRYANPLTYSLFQCGEESQDKYNQTGTILEAEYIYHDKKKQNNSIGMAYDDNNRLIRAYVIRTKGSDYIYKLYVLNDDNNNYREYSSTSSSPHQHDYKLVPGVEKTLAEVEEILENALPRYKEVIKLCDDVHDNSEKYPIPAEIIEIAGKCFEYSLVNDIATPQNVNDTKKHK